MFNKRNKLHKRLIQASSAEDVVRNHAYARVAGKSKAVPVRRTPTRGQAASGYRDSLVGSAAQYRTKLPPRSTEPEAGANTASQNPVIGNRPASSAADKGNVAGPAQRRHHFIEPPKRNFNRFD